MAMVIPICRRRFFSQSGGPWMYEIHDPTILYLHPLLTRLTHISADSGGQVTRSLVDVVDEHCWTLIWVFGLDGKCQILLNKNIVDKNWVKIWANYKRLISNLTQMPICDLMSDNMES